MSDVARSSSVRPDSLVNYVDIIVIANPAEPTPTLQVVQDANSQDIYGVQGVSLQSPLATNEDAQLLADYLIRPDPNYWFTGLTIGMYRLTDAQRLAVSQIDIGSFVSVTKSFKYGSPSTVTKNLYVEGVSHSITQSEHTIELSFSPVGFYQEWQEVTSTLTWANAPIGVSWTNLIWTQL
jgi:hypothetical protein